MSGKKNVEGYGSALCLLLYSLKQLYADPLSVFWTLELFKYDPRCESI